MFNVNDYVFILPTGDETIDRFLGQQVTIISVIPINDGGYRYTQFLLVNAAGDKVAVNENEIEKGERLNG